MEESSRRPASFSTQANALLRKNLTFQKRNVKANLRIVFFPVLVCVLLVVIQKVIDNELNKPENRCGCKCVDTDGDGKCEDVCGIQYSTQDQVLTCPIPSPPQWPALLQVPKPEFRAVKIGSNAPLNLPDMSCRKKGDCPSTVLFTGRNQTFATSLARNIFANTPPSNPLNFLNAGDPRVIFDTLSNLTLGTDATTGTVNFIEPAFVSERPIYNIQSHCNSTSIIEVKIPFMKDLPDISLDQQCAQGLNVWRESSSAINNELFGGYWQVNGDRSINEYMGAYDFLDSSTANFNMRIWYNSTFKDESMFGGPPSSLRVIRSVNLISNAFLQLLKGLDTKMQLDFYKQMPKPATQLSLDFSSLLGALFFTWIIELLLPVLLTYLVYEKQNKLRIMMKMHGLGDGPYWIITYAYFLLLSIVYVLFLVVFGSLIGLKYFTSNDYSIQFVFFFAVMNLQIALAFLMSTVFTKVKTAQGIAYIYVFGTGLLGEYLLRSFIVDETFPRAWVTVLQLLPGFSLYRGLYEFGVYSFNGRYMGTAGMRWKNLSDSTNGMREVLIIIAVEWIVILPVAYYFDQLASLGSRIRKNPLLFMQYFRKKVPTSFRRDSFRRQGSKVFVEVEKPDVAQERGIVEQLLLEPSSSHAIIADNLKKVYPGRDGNPDKLAVQGLSLAVQRGECFGFLGPNGAGKTSFISMMIGLISPTSGNAYVHGNSIQADMSKIYTSMGVCPQHDMLWEMLTGREHLLFYGRLKNLKGSALLQAVDESLKSVNLYHGGVGDKKAGKYSGGMKRRLSVAISLIGDPKVVYMDEPSTGLDPASRHNLWNVVKNAKQNRAIILTTHSMEEAEVLCDRLGIFISGGMECIGNPKQLKARYGGTYILTMTTSQNEEREVEEMVRKLSPNANRIYHISGTQKFEIPKQDIKIAQVFEAVEKAKTRFPIQAWGLADTTLEDVFIKVAKGNDSFNT